MTVSSVLVRIPQSLLKAAARRALKESRREESKGELRRFKSAHDAVEYLKRL